MQLAEMPVVTVTHRMMSFRQEKTMRAMSLVLVGLVAWLLTSFPASDAMSIFATGPHLPGEETMSLSAHVELTPTAWVYLPLVIGPPPLTVRKVNAPYFNVQDIEQSKFSETTIFWFGRVTPTENYADVRIGYNNRELYVRMAIFDRRLWYDRTPTPNDLTAWDSVTLYLNTAGNTGGEPGSSAYRFDAQLNDWEDPRTAWQVAYRGNGSGWIAATAPFTTECVYRWESDTQGGLNNNQNNRGWGMTFHIPFSSLSLSGPPPQGTIWGMAVALHDRDDQAGTSIADKLWPETINKSTPGTWGQLSFGLPAYSAPSAVYGGDTLIRHKLNGAMVPDAAVGGTVDHLCPGDSDYTWNVWGNANFAGANSFNVQNQADFADWPCFSKYYVTFPLGSVPPGKVIISATLTLYHWGNSGSLNDAQPSFIHVMTVAEDWNEATLTWNNAPMALENVGQAWVAPVTWCNWPCVPRTWDVSRAVAQAYRDGKSYLRLALYSTDAAYHSGKFFTTSDVEDWDEDGRPTLQVRWGNPSD